MQIMADTGDSSSPTDNSATLATTLSTTFDTSHSHPSSSGQTTLDVTRDELEKRELSHTVQLLRLELSQKQLVIEALKTEQASEVEELRERLADEQHEKKLLKLRLQSLSHAYEREVEQVRKKKKRETPLVQELTSDYHHEVDVAFDDVSITTEEYEQVKDVDKSLLPLSQIVKMRCYELTRPLLGHCEQLQASVTRLREELAEREKTHSNCQQTLSSVREEKTAVEERCSSLVGELASVRAQVQEGDYKINNFDAVKRERDALRSEVEALQKSLHEQEARERLVKEDLERSTKECSSAEQTVSLLRQDKDYLSGRVTALTSAVATAEEKVECLREELSEAKQAKETLYQQMMSDKEECRHDYDLRLQRELEGLRSRTALQMDQLKLQTMDFYERENHSLTEARDVAISEKERALAAEKETRGLYENLLKNFHELQASSDRQICELQATLKIANFEKERASLANQETVSQFRQCQLDREKLQKKLDLLNVELSSSRCEGESSVKRLEDQLEAMKLRLEGYEKIEKELDDVVLQSAQLEHECDAERVLFSYGFGTSVPTNSRRRLQQSVQLARRVLQLERLNSSLRQQISDEQARGRDLKEELSSIEGLLSKTHQPQSYIISSLREKEKVLKELRNKVRELEAQLNQSTEEKAKLVETKNQMAADLEKLLSHREELHHMRQVLVGVASQDRRPLHKGTVDPSLHIPPPTLFTRQGHRSVRATNKCDTSLS